MKTAASASLSAERGTVLIVDDVPANLSLLLDCLGGAGLEVRFAESGERALLQLDHFIRPPDLILLDVLMPGGLDGFETCRRIRERADCRDVPILFLTALSDPADKLRGFQAGAVDYIPKPLEPDEVLARVHAHLRLVALRRALEEEIRRRERAEAQLRQSLDRAVLVADRAEGRITFCSRLAGALLEKHFPGTAAGGNSCGRETVAHLPAPLRDFAERGRPLALPAAADGRRLRARLFSEAGGDESDCFLLLLEEQIPPAGAAALTQLGLTAREADVLYWIAQGKTSAQIAEILDAAVMTVKKHLQHIFDKLGVDSRTAAAVKALEVLGVPPRDP